MRISRKARLVSRLVFWASLATSSLAAAEPVNLAATDYHLTVVAYPSALVVGDFYSSVAGTVSISTRTFDFGDVLSTLSTNVFLGKGGGPAFSMDGAGSLMFEVSADQYFTTSFYMVSQGLHNYGLAAFDVTFSSAVPTPVDLPGTLWMLAGGVGLLLGWPRRGRAAPAAFPATA